MELGRRRCGRVLLQRSAGRGDGDGDAEGRKGSPHAHCNARSEGGEGEDEAAPPDVSDEGRDGSLGLRAARLRRRTGLEDAVHERLDDKGL